MPTYFPKRIEPKWQQYWLTNKTFHAVDGSPKPKYYILDMFPYPSSDGLHVGHPEGYTATDILSRYKRMRGFNVLHPMGWDAFGLPAEQYAVKTNTHPRVTTALNIQNFRRQIQMLGFSYDWDREIDTTDPGYYRWTQWIFLQLFNTWYDPESNRGRPIAELPIPAEVFAGGEEKIRRFQDEHRLAYVAEVPVNWCAELGTVLANEEVINGLSERGNHPVVRIPLRQWMLRITSYADRLLSDLDTVDWPEPIKEMQRNWIGRSEGAEVDFRLMSETETNEAVGQWFASREKDGFPREPENDVVRVFTTRPDTLFGATYMVLAPEHPLVERITTASRRDAVTKYREESARKSDLDRTDLAKQKTGVFTGAYAVNPVNQIAIPVWIADYVLMGYGTGAIMAVPAHDGRDFEFAEKFDLDIVEVVADPADTPRILLQVHKWLGEWERRGDDVSQEKYLRVALLLNCGFDLDNFEADLNENQNDPLWAEVNWYYDPKEGKGLAVSYLEDDFADVLLEYVDEQEDTQILVFSLQPPPDESFDENEDGMEEVEDEASPGLPIMECSHEGHSAEECDAHDDMTGAFTGEGISVDSGIITGLPTAEAKTVMTQWLEQKGLGRKTVNTKLRDWLFSRQRYWGEPFPILLDDKGNPHALEPTQLPVELPELSDFKPTGTPEPPLTKATEWRRVTKDAINYLRETNTMPQWAGSCWYYLRYLDPKNSSKGWDEAKEKYWMPVDLYVGGAEHAVLHLLYSRFWHKVLFDLGHVSTAEPFQKLINQGMILGEMEYVGYRLGNASEPGDWVSADDVIADPTGNGKARKKDQAPVYAVTLTEEQIAKDGAQWVLAVDKKVRVDARAFKMSKSRGNVINPDQVVANYGADALRLYEMFMGPLEATKPWSMQGVEGIWRFLNRVWRVVMDEKAEPNQLAPAVKEVEPNCAHRRMLHQTIRGVTEDIDAMRFNTAISKLMEYVNFLTPLDPRPKELLDPMVLLISPFAPHLAEELWESLGHATTLAYEPWPTFDESLCAADEIEVALQINNKVRSKLTVTPDIPDDALLALAGQESRIVELTRGKMIIKSFVVSSKKGKLVNFVVKE